MAIFNGKPKTQQEATQKKARKIGFVAEPGDNDSKQSALLTSDWSGVMPRIASRVNADRLARDASKTHYEGRNFLLELAQRSKARSAGMLDLNERFEIAGPGEFLGVVKHYANQVPNDRAAQFMKTTVEKHFAKHPEANIRIGKIKGWVKSAKMLQVNSPAVEAMVTEGLARIARFQNHLPNLVKEARSVSDQESFERLVARLGLGSDSLEDRLTRSFIARCAEVELARQDAEEKLDVEAALEEIQKDAEAVVEEKTAYKWASRAIACFKLAKKTSGGQKATWERRAIDSRHEAMEHAALMDDMGITVAAIQALIDEHHEEAEVKDQDLFQPTAADFDWKEESEDCFVKQVGSDELVVAKASLSGEWMCFFNQDGVATEEPFDRAATFEEAQAKCEAKVASGHQAAAEPQGEEASMDEMACHYGATDDEMKHIHEARFDSIISPEAGNSEKCLGEIRKASSGETIWKTPIAKSERSIAFILAWHRGALVQRSMGECLPFKRIASGCWVAQTKTGIATINDMADYFDLGIFQASASAGDREVFRLRGSILGDLMVQASRIIAEDSTDGEVEEGNRKDALSPSPQVSPSPSPDASLGNDQPPSVAVNSVDPDHAGKTAQASIGLKRDHEGQELTCLQEYRFAGHEFQWWSTSHGEPGYYTVDSGEDMNGPYPTTSAATKDMYDTDGPHEGKQADQFDDIVQTQDGLKEKTKLARRCAQIGEPEKEAGVDDLHKLMGNYEVQAELEDGHEKGAVITLNRVALGLKWEGESSQMGKFGMDMGTLCEAIIGGKIAALGRDQKLVRRSAELILYGPDRA